MKQPLPPCHQPARKHEKKVKFVESCRKSKALLYTFQALLANQGIPHTEAMSDDEKLTSELLAERIRIAIDGFSKSEIARECGVSRQAVTGWIKNGRIDKAHLITLSKITGIPIEYWLGGDTPTQDLDPHEEKILLFFRALPEEKKLQLLEHAQSLYSKQYSGYRSPSLYAHEPTS